MPSTRDGVVSLKWSRLRGLPKKGMLVADEIREAEIVWLRKIQRKELSGEYGRLSLGQSLPSQSSILKLDPFFDPEKQLIRVGIRLQFAQIPEEAKHQIIIPHKDPLVEKLVLHLHCKASHAGPDTTLAILRQRIWLTRGRREVKRVLTKCLVCKHWKTQPCQQKMAPLPSEQVQMVPAFTNVSLDFTGLLYQQEPRPMCASLCAKTPELSISN